MNRESLSESLEEYLKTENGTPTSAELPQIAALRMMATTLDAQYDGEGPAVSLLSAYARELARFQKGRASQPATKSALAQALEGLDDE